MQKNAFNLEKQNEKLIRMNEDKDISINDLIKKNDINQRKIENLNNKIDLSNSEKNEQNKKYNNLHSLYKDVTREVNKLERKLRENDLELNNTKKESERDINNLKETNKKYNDDYNKLYNKLIDMQDELNGLKNENESLLNQNKSLCNNNESMITERKYNNEIISEYKKTIEKLQKENNDLKNTLKSRKYNTSSKSSGYDDEIVIVNKETTYSKGLFQHPNEFNKYGLIKNKYEIKRKADITSDEILKYHEIIQDLSNMILIYEKFFFKGKIKPKNNHELFCYLIVQYINEKFRKIKLSVFMKLLFAEDNKKNNNKFSYLKRNNSNFGTKYENNINTFSERTNSRKRGYFSEKNRINNNYH